MSVEADGARWQREMEQEVEAEGREWMRRRLEETATAEFFPRSGGKAHHRRQQPMRLRTAFGSVSLRVWHEQKLGSFIDTNRPPPAGLADNCWKKC